MDATAQETGKRRSQRSSDVLQDYLKGLDNEHSHLVAQRDYLQAWIDLVERQRANLQEVIDIEKKLADMSQGSPAPLGTPSAGGSKQSEAVAAQ